MSQHIHTNEILKKNFLIFGFILLCLITAHFPVLTSDFLRQDDWNATFWSKHSLFFLPGGHPEYWNAAFELFRPIGALFLLISDYICINIENAKFVKLFTIILMSISAYITYIWQNKFNPDNKIFSITFSILSFCLIASQLHTATAGYNGMVVTLLCGQIALIYFYKALIEEKNYIFRKKYIIFSGALILAGALNYAISMMYYFLFLFIFYISNFDKDYLTKRQIYTFLIQSTVFIISLMVLYVLMAKSAHFVLDIHEKMHGGYVRSIHINWDIMNKVHNILVMIKYSFNVFNVWAPYSSHRGITNINIFFSAAFLTTFLFFVSIFIKLNLQNSVLKDLKHYINIFSKSVFIFIISLFLLILSYTPVLPLEVVADDGSPFKAIMTNRYFIVTMPFILYIMMWSINCLGSLKKFSAFNYFFKNLVLLLALVFGIYNCNYSLKNYIVHPHMTEMDHIKKHIEKNVLKIVKSGEKPTIIIIRNPNFKEVNQGNDYDLTINHSHNWLISATIYTLRQYDIKTIRSHKVITWKNDLGIHILSDWGELASVNNISTFNLHTKKNTVIIDMNELKIRNLYRAWLNSKN